VATGLGCGCGTAVFDVNQSVQATVQAPPIELGAASGQDQNVHSAAVPFKALSFCDSASLQTSSKCRWQRTFHHAPISAVTAVSRGGCRPKCLLAPTYEACGVAQATRAGNVLSARCVSVVQPISNVAENISDRSPLTMELVAPALWLVAPGPLVAPGAPGTWWLQGP
jgi:hypothetical protein